MPNDANDQTTDRPPASNEIFQSSTSQWPKARDLLYKTNLKCCLCVIHQHHIQRPVIIDPGERGENSRQHTLGSLATCVGTSPANQAEGREMIDED